MPNLRRNMRRIGVRGRNFTARLNQSEYLLFHLHQRSLYPTRSRQLTEIPQMDQTTHMNRFSPPIYTGALQLDPYSRPPPSNPGIFTPSSVLFPPQRSPKGPRPAPSSAHAQNFIEPARIPLPADDVDTSQHATTTNAYYYGDVEEEFSGIAAEPSRRVSNKPHEFSFPIFLTSSALTTSISIETFQKHLRHHYSMEARRLPRLLLVIPARRQFPLRVHLISIAVIPAF